MLLYVHRNHKAYSGRGAQDGHLDFHTAPELWTTIYRSMTFTLWVVSRFDLAVRR